MSRADEFAGLARLLEQRGPRKLVCVVGDGVSDSDATRFVSSLQALEFEVELKRDTRRFVLPGQVVVVRDPGYLAAGMGPCND